MHEYSSSPYDEVLISDKAVLSYSIKLFLNTAMTAQTPPNTPDPQAMKFPLPVPLQVEIELTDVNDASPVWSESSYTAVVPENTPVGSPVTNVLATDPDLGINGLVRYQLPELQGEVDGEFARWGMAELASMRVISRRCCLICLLELAKKTYISFRSVLPGPRERSVVRSSAPQREGSQRALRADRTGPGSRQSAALLGGHDSRPHW